MATVQETRAATYARVIHVPADRVKPNPWQPRRTIDPGELEDLAESIAAQGLLQPPIARPLEDGSVQLAFGHRRVEAIRLLIAAGRWEGGVPISVKELSDADMALLALAENAKRKDITALEEYRAYRRALDEIPGITVAAIARALNIDRSTLSNNLRILHLPGFVLERVESGEMAPRAARELLCLMNEDHVHEQEMKTVINWISDTGGSRGAPDWSTGHVREKIRRAVESNGREWRPLAPWQGDASEGYAYSHLDSEARREPGFDVEAFKKAFAHQVHLLPRKDGKSREWTCNVREWRRRQTTATREQNRAGEAPGEDAAAGAGSPPARDSASTKLTQAILSDPLLLQLRGVVMETPAEFNFFRLSADHPLFHVEKGMGMAFCGVKADLQQAQIVRGPGDRVPPHRVCSTCAPALEPQAGQGKKGHLTEEELTALGTRAQPVKDPYSGFHQRIGEGLFPPGFPDREECLTRCTWGAHYVQEYRGGSFSLQCRNEKCYNDKKSRGIQTFLKELELRRTTEDQADIARAEEMADGFAKDYDGKEVAKEVTTALLLLGDGFKPVNPAPGMGRARYHPKVLQEATATLGVALEMGTPWNPSLDAAKAIEALQELDQQQTRWVAACLVVWALRTRGGIRADS